MTVALAIAMAGCPINFVLGCAYATAARRRFVRSLMPTESADYLDADMGRGGWDHRFHTSGDTQ